LCRLQESADLHCEGGHRKVHEVLGGVTGVLLGGGVEEGVTMGQDGEEGDSKVGCTP
jgi:hypothetical protein